MIAMANELTLFLDAMYTQKSLEHHGVKGMHWGEWNEETRLRRLGGKGPSQKATNGDYVLKKGSSLRTVNSRYTKSTKKMLSDAKNTNRWIYTYDADNKWDNKVYKGPFARYLISGRAARKIAEHRLTPIKDLKMPSRETRINTFVELLNDPKFNKTMIKELKHQQEIQKRYNFGLKEARNVNLDKLDSKKSYESAYMLFSSLMQNSYMYKSTMEYSKRMMANYDAMVDDHNLGVYNGAQNPVIVFKAENLIAEYRDKPALLKMRDIQRNLNDVRIEMNKQGKSVLY